MELTDSAGAYDEVKTTVEKIASALSDEGFVKKDSDYTATLDLSEEGVNMKVALTLTMKNGEVTAYSMDMTMTAVEEETEVVMTVTAAVDEKDRMTMTMRMDMASLLTLEMNMDCAYTQGKTAPVTEPPAGANVVDYMELLNAQMGADVGVIGGADGPTSIIVGE